MNNNKLFTENGNHKNASPLPERMRPTIIDDILGQTELLAPDASLRNLIDSDSIPSLLFWGPPGCGKTTLARVIANNSAARFLEYSAVQIGSKELKLVMSEAGKILSATGQKTVIFLDEIHRFNKSQQDSLLPPVERGDVILIGATTENPSFEINSALLSRMRLFTLDTLQKQDLVQLINRALTNDEIMLQAQKTIEADAVELIATIGDGDARAALSLLEMAVISASSNKITVADLESMILNRTLRYDRAGDEHHKLISALHKSVRNSDPDAAIYYLARMLESGEDPLYIARRMIRMASEDIGLADPQSMALTVAAKDAVQFVGMPEGALSLAQAIVHLSMAPKSNAIYKAYSNASKLVRNNSSYAVPLSIQNAPTKLMKQLGYGKNYEYAHNNDEGVSAMQCLPDEIKNERFYFPTNRGLEKRYRERLETIMSWKKEKRQNK